MDTNISSRFMLVHFLFLFPKNHLSLRADTTFANQSISGNQTIVFAHGIFELGFFRPEDPAPGLFSFELDPTEESFVILWNMSIKHWSSGAWNEIACGWNLFLSKPRQECVQAFCEAYGICNENSLPFCNCLMGFKPNSQSNWDLEDYSGGCIRKSPLHCGNNNLANAYTFDNNGRSVWTVELVDLQVLAVGDSGARTLYIRLAASEFRSL
ncbi:S-locus glycoprotein domain containing protein [Trema orientale]|uniref:S-locus glycoprotein domain containing protein n=1 Tax=Trema orientale TaxID=63057 RepID=A0A2P5BBA2_TREOI|nr:S-locus glycoprotein domain containing protein [Trema orientale]